MVEFNCSKMKRKPTRYNQYFFSLARKSACVFLLFFLTISCTDKEPDFTIKGDEAITKDLKVNVAIMKDKELAMATVFYNGESYKVNNEGTLRYTIYVSYKDSLFYKVETDNLHGKIKGEPINEIRIERKNDSITVLYRPLMESKTTGGIPLKPLDVLYENVKEKAIEKPKFTTLYKTK